MIMISAIKIFKITYYDSNEITRKSFGFFPQISAIFRIALDSTQQPVDCDV